MAQEKQTNNELLEFDWGNENDDFFGIGDTTPKPTPQPKPQEAQPAPTPKPTPEDEEEEEDEDDDFFEEKDENGKPTPKPKPADNTSSDNTDTSVYLDLVKDMKETGIFRHIEIEEDEEIDAERFQELVEDEYEAEVSERIKAWATEELDEDARAFIKFKKEGGKTEDFFRAYSSPSAIPEGDIDDEDYQDSIIRYQLSQEGWDKDEVEDRIAYLTESGRKEKVAKKYDDKLKEQREKEKAELLKQQEKAKQQAKQQEEEFKQTLKEALDETEEINGFRFSAEDKQKVLKFLTKKEHKVSDSKSVTGFQKKMAEVFNDTDKMILLAKIIESDFDFSGFEKATKTKQTRQVKTNLEQRKSLRPSGSGSSSQGTGLADLF